MSDWTKVDRDTGEWDLKKGGTGIGGFLSGPGFLIKPGWLTSSTDWLETSKETGSWSETEK